MRIRDYLLPPAFQKKAGEVQRSIVRMMGLEALWSDRDYENFAKEGYNANVWVYACIAAIAQNASTIPLKLYADRTKQKEVAEHELLDLLYRPNEFQSREELLEAFIAYYLIAGNSYLDMVGPSDNVPPKELWTLRPDRMQILPDKMNYIKGYQYTVAGHTTTLDRKRVSHLKNFNPIHDFYGLSQIEIAAKGIDNANAASAWNNALLNNGARPSGAFVTDDALSDTQYDRMKEAVNVNYVGKKNAGKPMILEAGLKWQEMSLSPRDMDFLESKKMSGLEICAAFRVPPEIVGIGDSKTFANYEEARKALYEDAVIPVLRKVIGKLNADLVSRFDGRLYLDMDLSNVEALQDNKEVMYERVVKAYLGGLLRKNEGRNALGFEDDPDGGEEYVPDPRYAAMDDHNGNNFSGGGRGRGRGNSNNDDEGNGKKSSFFLTNKAFDLQTDAQKFSYWQDIEKRRERWYAAVEYKVRGTFEKEHRAVVEAYKAGGEKAVMNLFKQNSQMGYEWKRLFSALYVEVMQEFGENMFNNFKKHSIADLETKGPFTFETVFKVFDKAVQKFIASTVAKKVVAVTNTTKKAIRGIIAKGEAQGKTVAAIANDLDKLYLDEIIPKRTYVIARTEVIGASNAGNRYAAKQTGLQLEKQWLSTPDDRTRDSHVSIDGETQPMDEKYSNGLMFPGDPEGAAEEVIQCRCTEIYNVIE
ncbi:portal protein [Bacillus phage Silence]|nr:portal protein [Bacillus phage Silence]